MKTTYTFAEVLGEYTVAELKEMAKGLKLSGYSRMKKDEVIELIKGITLDRELVTLKFLTASERDMELFEEAMNHTVLVDQNAMGYRYWLEMLVAFITKKHAIVIPTEIQEEYAKFKADEELQADRKLNALIHEYALACTNLYSIIALDKFVEIMNSQNEQQVTAENVIEWCSLRYLVHGCSMYMYQDGYIMEDIYGENDFDVRENYKEMLEKQGDKEYYIPEREELLRYADVLYVEETPQFSEMFAFIQKNSSLTAEQVYDVCAELQLMIRDGSDTTEIIEMVCERGLELTKDKDANRFFEKFIRMQCTTRMPEHRGLTQNEVEPESALATIASTSTTTVVNEQPKVYPNDPCPCGSGKKFKKCCARK